MFLYTTKPRNLTLRGSCFSWLISLKEFKSYTHRPQVLALAEVITYFG
jgi:hypothetical protein